MITIEKTEFQRLRVNNSADSDRSYDISASVTIDNGIPQTIQNGQVKKRSDDKSQVTPLATFEKSSHSFNINFQGNPGKETRLDVFATVQDFAEIALNQNTYIN